MARTPIEMAIAESSTAQPAKQDEPIGTQMQNIGTVVGLANPVAGTGLSTLGFLSNMYSGGQQLNQPMVSGPSILHALSQTMAGKVLGLSSPVTNQQMYGGASPGDFSPEQQNTTGFGKGLTPEQISNIYGNPIGTTAFSHADNVAQQLALSEDNTAAKAAAQQAIEQSIATSGPHGGVADTSSGFGGATGGAGTDSFGNVDRAEGGMIGNDTPLKDLFMGIYG